jgi:hypothetical protein
MLIDAGAVGRRARGSPRREIAADCKGRSFPVVTSVTNRRESSRDRSARDATNDQAIAHPNERPTTIRLRLDTLDVREEELLVLQRDLGAALQILVGELLQTLAEDLGPKSGGGVTLCAF